MESVLLVVHVVIALVIVGLIMIQQGKGAEMGASFGGGGSQTVFGAAGSGNFFSRMTAILVAIFFATSFTLAMLAKSNVGVDDSIIPFLDEPVEQSVVPTAESTNPVPTVQDGGNVVPEVDTIGADDGATGSEVEVPASK